MPSWWSKATSCWKYGINTDPRAHISWSMAKSITQAMYGAALLDGMPIDLYGPAPVAAWNEQPDDPRAAITIDQMLLMRSGLEWNEEYEGTSDVIEMLFVSGAADRGGFAAAKPLEFEPDTVWEYSTGTSMILGRILGDYIGLGDEGAAWAQEHLFGPIGITTVRHTLDEVGAMSSGSMIDMTALDFARFGLLYLRGTWTARRSCPPDGPTTPACPRPARRCTVITGGSSRALRVDDRLPAGVHRPGLQRSADRRGAGVRPGRRRAVERRRRAAGRDGVRLGARLLPGCRRGRRLTG